MIAELNALTTKNFKAPLVADFVKVSANNKAMGNPVSSKPTYNKINSEALTKVIIPAAENNINV